MMTDPLFPLLISRVGDFVRLIPALATSHAVYAHGFLDCSQVACERYRVHELRSEGDSAEKLRAANVASARHTLPSPCHS